MNLPGLKNYLRGLAIIEIGIFIGNAHGEDDRLKRCKYERLADNTESISAFFSSTFSGFAIKCYGYLAQHRDANTERIL